MPNDRRKPVKFTDIDYDQAANEEKPLALAVPEPEVSELCVYLKCMVRAELKAAMQSHEAADLQYKIYAAIDAIDAAHTAYRRHNKREEED
jgi:hypothetical protein